MIDIRHIMMITPVYYLYHLSFVCNSMLYHSNRQRRTRERHLIPLIPIIGLPFHFSPTELILIIFSSE